MVKPGLRLRRDLRLLVVLGRQLQIHPSRGALAGLDSRRTSGIWMVPSTTRRCSARATAAALRLAACPVDSSRGDLPLQFGVQHHAAHGAAGARDALPSACATR